VSLYRESGGYCAPTSDRAPAAVPKGRGQPSGWTQERRLLRRDAAALTLPCALSYFALTPVHENSRGMHNA
jgi:hypothetical protein